MKDVIPGKTNDWCKKMQKDLVKLLEDNGIYPDELTDLELIFKVPNFLSDDNYDGNRGTVKINDISQTEFHMYDWYTTVDENNNPVLNENLFKKPGNKEEILNTLKKAEKDLGSYSGKDWTQQDLINIMTSTKEMFYKRYHGSCCTTSAFYATIFQALGIPMKVMPIATTIDTGKMDEGRGIEYQLLYKL